MRGLVREGVGSHFIDAPGSKSGAGRRVVLAAVLAPTFNAPGVTPEVRIYKRKQESKKKKKKGFF